jgi:phosphatidylserine/phosphatidylglycerophosphate/cardiolipin synthase-like enzyme
MSNIITIASEGGKKKKGGGTNAVLTLMKELGDFQDKVQTCIDAQDLADRSQKLEVFYDKLDEMAEVLLEMAADGIKSKRQMDALEDDIVEDPEGDSVEEPIEEVLSDRPRASSVGRIQMINAPSIPKLPR